MSASATRANALQQPEKAANQGNKAQKIGESALQVSLCEFLTFNSRCGGVVQTFPSKSQFIV
jgi:hypothetical protein